MGSSCFQGGVSLLGLLASGPIDGGAAGGFDLATIGRGLAGGAGDLSGLTAGDVSFLGPDVIGEASAAGAVPPPPVGFASGGMAPVGASFTDSAPVQASIDYAAFPGSTGASAAAGGATDPAFAFSGSRPGPFNPATANIGAAMGTTVMGWVPGGTAATPGFMDSVGSGLSSIGNFLGSPAGRGATAVAGLGGLGFNLYEGYQQKKQMNALNAQENQI